MSSLLLLTLLLWFSSELLGQLWWQHSRTYKVHILLKIRLISSFTLGLPTVYSASVSLYFLCLLYTNHPFSLLVSMYILVVIAPSVGGVRTEPVVFKSMRGRKKVGLCAKLASSLLDIREKVPPLCCSEGPCEACAFFWRKREEKVLLQVKVAFSNFSKCNLLSHNIFRPLKPGALLSFSDSRFVRRYELCLK